MTGPDDTDNHNFTQQDVNTILGVVEPHESSTPDAPGAVDPTDAQARADRIARVTAVLLASGADPDDLRFLAQQVWMQGWTAGWDERGDAQRHVSRNPYDAEPSS